MIRKLVREEDILNPAFRKKVIDEILAPENVTRKTEALKRYELYKDNIKKWVMQSLAKDGLKDETLAQMQNRAASISICKKIVNKLATTYSGGVDRSASDEVNTAAIQDLARSLEADCELKKADRYRELFKNCEIQVIPQLDTAELGDETKKYELAIKVLAPFQFDVIEDAYNHEEQRVVILTDFVERTQFVQMMNADNSDGRSGILISPSFGGNGRDEIIADAPEDAGTNVRTFIWWSNKYHFTTDVNGAVIRPLSPDGYLNPIGKLPFVNVAEEKDGEFWAKGGDDLIEGSILINVLLTDMNSIAYMQGWGQMVVTGKNLPKRLEGGTHNALVLEQDVGDPTPNVFFASANPPIETWMKMVEQYMALLLSTNDLAPSIVASKLDSVNAPSGIAMLIEQSEVTRNIQDKQKLFTDVERELWEVAALWQNLYFESQALTDEFMEIGKIDAETVQIKFNEVKPVMSEKDKLDNLKLRQDLGINTMVDLIKIDNPALNDEEAAQKLKEIMAEKLSKVKMAIGQQLSGVQQDPYLNQ